MIDIDAKLKDQILNGTAPLNSTPTVVEVSRAAAEIRKGRACDVILCIYYYSPGCCSWGKEELPSTCPRAIRAQLAALRTAGDALATTAETILRQCTPPNVDALEAAAAAWRAAAGPQE